jgi:hypothetical protein
MTTVLRCCTAAEQLEAELHWLDLLLVREIVRFRALRPRSPDGYQGLYIGEAEVDRLLSEALGVTSEPSLETTTLVDQLSRQAAEVHAVIGGCSASGSAQPASGLNRLAGRCGLGPLQRAALMVAAAPDLDARYETLFAYLQDDVTRRRPTIGLALSLLCDSRVERWRARALFGTNSDLFRCRLIHAGDELPFLSRPLRVDDRVLDALLETPAGVDARLAPFVRLALDQDSVEPELPAEVRRGLDGLLRLWRQNPNEAGWQPVATFETDDRDDALSCAAYLGRALGMAQLAVDLAALQAISLPAAEAVALVKREALLADAVVVLLGAGSPAREGARAGEISLAFEQVLRHSPVPVAVSHSPSVDPRRIWPDTEFVRLAIGMPALDERAESWRRFLEHEGVSAQDAEVNRVAAKFRLSSGRIARAVTTARHLAVLDGEERGLRSVDLHAAARAHSHQGLVSLARKIVPKQTWDDLVLPVGTAHQLREIVAAVEHREMVLESWGFGRLLSNGRGLNVLFSGPSGTGKTMAAEVLAGELGLDLYAIDLAMVLSKWIGETEQHLRTIFQEAQSSNAILFFDEADALFSKRSDVKDAHDRYANVEVAYLLQLMEGYEGMAVLATNLSKNLDDAFSRRMRYVVEFPFPDETLRRALWQKAFPADTPVEGDLDVTVLAHRFELAGGHIRSAALSAAVLAAADGGCVAMKHAVLAVAREYQKLGRLPSRSEFGPFYGAVLGHLGGREG